MAAAKTNYQKRKERKAAQKRAKTFRRVGAALCASVVLGTGLWVGSRFSSQPQSEMSISSSVKKIGYGPVIHSDGNAVGVIVEDIPQRRFVVPVAAKETNSPTREQQDTLPGRTLPKETIQKVRDTNRLGHWLKIVQFNGLDKR
ncbi:MAG: hypothetical protein SFW62_03610 [Alphaproteobacteria bacterium]|nr:hypothetical protein [Alphaproteobacteria bacterium]